MNRRILLLVTDLQIGGTPTVVREIAVRLHQVPQVEMNVACLDRRGPVAEQITKQGVPVTALAARGPHDLRVIKSLIDLIHRQRIDTVLSFLVHSNAVAAAASHFCPGVRFLQSIQTTQPLPRWHWLVQKWAQRHAERIVVPSQSVAEVAQKWADVPAAKIVIIPNGIDLPATLPAPAPPGEPRRVVFLGRLDPVKRLPDLLTAIELLHGFARLDIYGEGSQRTMLELQIQRRGLGALVTLHGAIANPADALHAAELLVLPSQAEGFGLVLIEAMAAGVPVVATDAPGIRDVVRSGKTGLLVPVGSPPALAEAIRKVLTDEQLRKSLIAAAWNDVRQRFAWDSAMTAYRHLLRF